MKIQLKKAIWILLSSRLVRALLALGLGFTLALIAFMAHKMANNQSSQMRIEAVSPMTSTNWLETAMLLEESPTRLSFAKSLTLFGWLFDAREKESTKENALKFFEPVRDYIRRETQFSELREIQNDGCLQTHVVCHGGSQFSGESYFDSKYDLSLSVYGAIGGSFARFIEQSESEREDHFMDTEDQTFQHVSSFLQFCSLLGTGRIVRVETARCSYLSPQASALKDNMGPSPFADHQAEDHEADVSQDQEALSTRPGVERF